MDRESGRHKNFARRAAMLAGGKLALVSVLMGRMYYLQVVESDQYQMLADENRINMRLLPPPRGLIFDRFGREIANNRRNYRVVLVAEQANDIEETIRRLASVVPINEYQRRKILREIRRRRQFVPVTVAENLTWEQFSRLNVVLPELPGVQPDVGETRHYPYGSHIAHVIGYVAAVSEEELTGDPVLELPGFRIGKNGIEKVYDEHLRGKAGSLRVEVNAYGRVIRELVRKDGEPGNAVALTVDAELQDAIAKRLGEDSAAAVVMDVHNGEVFALVSTPAYDPNAFNIGLSGKGWRELVDHPRAPLINKAIAGQYPPGSAFKMVAALAALEAGVITPEHRVHCDGMTRLGNAKFHCWRFRYGGHGSVDLDEAIAQSCDLYFYDIAKRVGVDRMADMAKRLGLGVKLGIGLPAERRGLVPTKAWKQAVLGVPWQLGETLITGIGQAFLLATPLQLATMTSRLVNGGYAVTPTLVLSDNARNGAAGDKAQAAAPAERPSLGINQQHLQSMLQAMDHVVNGRRGTASRYRLDKELGVRMGGKTGTAQVRRITKAERQAGGKLAEDTPWEERDHSLFVAFAPVEEPRYAVALIVEHGGSGTYAAGVSRDIMTEVLKRDPARRPASGPVAGAGAKSETG